MARREYARIGTDMPDEKTVRACTMNEQWLYDHALYLRPEMSRCGVVPYRPAVWAELATDSTESKMRRLIKSLAGRRMVVVDEKYSEVFVRTFVKHDKILSQPNVVANMVGDFQVISSPTIRAAVLTELRRLWDLPDLTDGERGGWQLAMGHYPAVKNDKNQAWPGHLDAASLSRLRKSIGAGLAEPMTEHIVKGSAPPFTEPSPGGLPKPFDQTPYAGAIAVSTFPEHRAPSPSTGASPPGQTPALPGDPAPPDTAQQLIAGWLEHTPKRPPNAVIGQVGKQLAAMLTEGQDPDELRDALPVWAGKGLHPSALPSVVHELQTRPSRQASTTDQRVNASLARAAELRAQESA